MKDKSKLTGEVVSCILVDYIGNKPDKDEICPLIMIMMDYYADDHAEDHMSIREFMDDA